MQVLVHDDSCELRVSCSTFLCVMQRGNFMSSEIGYRDKTKSVGGSHHKGKIKSRFDKISHERMI